MYTWVNINPRAPGTFHLDTESIINYHVYKCLTIRALIKEFLFLRSLGRLTNIQD